MQRQPGESRRGQRRRGRHNGSSICRRGGCPRKLRPCSFCQDFATWEIFGRRMCMCGHRRSTTNCPPAPLSTKLSNGLLVVNCRCCHQGNSSERPPLDTMLDLSCPSSAPSIGPPQSRIPPAHARVFPFYARPCTGDRQREGSAARR